MNTPTSQTIRPINTASQATGIVPAPGIEMSQGALLLLVWTTPQSPNISINMPVIRMMCPVVLLMSVSGHGRKPSGNSELARPAFGLGFRQRVSNLGKLVSLARLARKVCIGRRIVLEALGFGVPFELAAHLVGDVPDVTHVGRAVGDLDVASGQGPRLQAVEEVAH